MKYPIKPFGGPETPEAKAVRLLLATPGFADSVLDVEYVNADGETLGETQTAPFRAIGERYTLTEAGAAKHDEILAAL